MINNNTFIPSNLDKVNYREYNPIVCGRGGIGIRARLRGVSGNGYGFKSRRPHYIQQVLPAVFFQKNGWLMNSQPGSEVEMRGVEPLSENPSTGLSPSAFRILISLYNRLRKN